MPYRILFSEEEELGVVELSGTVRWPDVADAMRALFLHPGWSPDYTVLWDTRHVRSVDIPPDAIPDIQEVKEELAAQRDGGRTAVVAVREAVTIVAQYITWSGRTTRRRYGVFGTLAEGLAFLGRDRLPPPLPSSPRRKGAEGEEVGRPGTRWVPASPLLLAFRGAFVASIEALKALSDALIARLSPHRTFRPCRSASSSSPS